MDAFKSQPCSRKQIADLTMIARIGSIEKKSGKVNVIRALENPLDFDPMYSYEIVPDSCFRKNVHADTDVIGRTIRIKESVYDGAYYGNGRDRMTIAHELGHYYIVCVCGLRLRRNFSKVAPRAFEDPEWQAKCFAGELLAPSRLIVGMSADEVVSVFGVSHEAAVMQLRASKGGRMV